jgi:hypothetical protein
MTLLKSQTNLIFILWDLFLVIHGLHGDLTSVWSLLNMIKHNVTFG